MKRTACEVQNRNNNSGCGDSNSDRDNNNTYSNPPNKVRRAGNATPLLFGNDARPFETNNCPRELQVAWENVSKDYQAVAVSEQENDVNRYSKSQNIFVCKIRKAHSFHTSFSSNASITFATSFFICICFYSVIGFPSGSTVLKKFSRFATLQTLYDFVRVTLSLEQSKFSIVTDHPRVVYDSYPMNTLLLGSGKPKPVVFQACIH